MPKLCFQLRTEIRIFGHGLEKCSAVDIFVTLAGMANFLAEVFIFTS